MVASREHSLLALMERINPVIAHLFCSNIPQGSWH